MLLFLLPLLFNPFGQIIKWAPAMYLAAWPIIIQTLGREVLITHALVLIMFILTCDISRQIMLNTIGFDLMSFPLGIALLLGLTTDKGTFFLSMIRPIFSGLLVVVEPLFLLIEIFIFMDMIQSFNRWISGKANELDENSDDLSNWEPPLTRSAVMARIAVIIITISSYIGVYMIIQESKSLLGIESQVPVNFNHAIAALVTLQLIAFSATVYKDEGVLSETALVAFLAAIPIFIASWSYYHLIVTANTASSPWTSYFPFSIFSGSSDYVSGQTEEAPTLHEPRVRNVLFGDDHRPMFGDLPLGEFGILEKAIGQLDGRLIKNINSILGGSLDKLAKYYFGPDFWCILACRFVCLFWWAMRRRTNNDSANELAAGDAGAGAAAGGALKQIRTIWLDLSAWLPMNARSFVKILLVLAYAQMLIQQMDNKHHLREQVSQLGGSSPSHAGGRHHQQAPCCGGGGPAAVSGQQPGAGSAGSSAADGAADLGAWFSCMWDSARTCSGGGGGGEPSARSRAARYLRILQESALNASQLAQKLWGQLDFGLVYHAWLARWRSNIVQRLCQSMLVQVYYIARVLFVYE